METTNNRRWEVPEDVDQDKVSLESLKFIFEQSENFLNDSIVNSTSISAKTNFLLTLLAGLLVGIMGYIFNCLHNKITDTYFFSAFFAEIYLYAVTIYTAFNFSPKGYYISGSEPKALFNKEIFSKEDSVDENDRFLIKNEIESYQERISKNEKLNNKRWNHYTNGLWAIILLPVVMALFLIIIKMGHCS